VAPWVPLVGIAVPLAYGWDLVVRFVRYEAKGLALGNLVLVSSRSAVPKRRIDCASRPSWTAWPPTFGVAAIKIYIVSDPAYNAALVPTGSGLSFFVTDALMRDFELIELEGVVAHCLRDTASDFFCAKASRHRRASDDESRRALAARGLAYRADEVAAAASAIPPGLAGALRSVPERTSRAPRFSPARRTRSGAGSGSTSGAIDQRTSVILTTSKLRARSIGRVVVGVN